MNVLSGELQQKHNEIKNLAEKFEQHGDNSQQRLQQTERDMQLTIQHERNVHEEEIERITRERVCWSYNAEGF